MFLSDLLTAHEPELRKSLQCRQSSLRFMGSFHDLTIARWDHEPLRLTEARSGPRVSDPQPTRFMESFHGFATAHLDHERWGETPSSPDLPATGIS